MRTIPLHSELVAYLRTRKLERKFDKQKRLLEENPFHPGLHVELLHPKHLRLFSFRIDKKYRAIFIFIDQETIEVIDVNNHYR
ncbi:MAG: hypothetical protein A3C06_00560 [Candidatus Taylorbacteria bacterium RIFCSPHIGHO2_02_FULL_46_13]|uniref:Toxin YoeB n=1 Tax=Candidatus Taylorbacteria bacterium RIFCSPHIGHO2_02_FULL_46_13 TaxID=1802312 RepID=A0A1G2MVQ5_9BACT|nr:MAG: hypothetical protein A3C06_00560 [Candidatus Taylorbacteria bacterium RIFCSPHIGHO2_02_FULL_46_13]